MKYIVQVWCTGIGWANSKWGGDTLAEAVEAQSALLANDDAWVNPKAKRQTQIVSSFPIEIEGYKTKTFI